MLSLYCLSPLDAIAIPMAAPYISALYDGCGSTIRENALGSFCHRNSRGLVLGARDFHRLQAAVGIQGRAFRPLLIVLTPSNARKCRGSKNCTHRPPDWHPRTRGDKIGPSYLTLPSRGPKNGRIGYITPAFLWVPQG